MNYIAISLLNRNGLNDTISCIDSLLNSSFDNFTIYLLDNGSKNPWEFLKLQEKYKNNSKIILNKSEKNLWFTWGNNFNITKTLKNQQAEYILLLNNDCKVEKDFLQNFIDQVQKIEKVGIFGPIIKGYDESIQAIGSNINLWTGSSKRIKQLEKEYQTVDYVTGSCMLISREVIEKIWILDDQFFAYWEESDFALRAKKANYQTFALNVDWIYHKEESANRKDKPYYTYLMFRNRILFLKKHANWVQYVFSYFILLAYLIVIFPRYFGIKNYQRAWKGIKDGIQGKWGAISN